MVIGNLVRLHNIVAASAVVQLASREGEVMRQTVLATLVDILLGGISALFLFA